MALDYKFKYFTWTEIEKPFIDKFEAPKSLEGNIIPTVRVLDMLREYYGKPIIINSSYRTHKYNKEVGGKDNSLHLSYNAIDFTVKNKEDLRGLYLTLDLWDKVPNKFDFLPKAYYNLGLGYYPNRFIHIDTRSILNRKAPARWNG